MQSGHREKELGRGRSVFSNATALVCKQQEKKAQKEFQEMSSFVIAL